MALPKSYSLNHAAEAYGVSTKTLRRRIADGRLPACRSGKLIRVAEDDLKKMFAPIPAACR